MNLRPRAVNFDDVWSNLRESVEAIISLRPIKKITWDHNFSDIYFICVAVPEAQTKKLYLAVKECLQRHARIVRKVLSTLSGDQLLNAYNREWAIFRQGTTYLHNLYGYLNKQLVKEKLDAESLHTFMTDDSEGPFPQMGVGDLAFAIWRTELINPLAQQLVSHIVKLIDAFRKEETSFTSANIYDVRGAVLSFIEVNENFSQESFSGQQKSPFLLFNGFTATEFYEEIFERHFLEATEVYYHTLTSETFAHLDCCPYMESVIQKMNDERNLTQRLLHHSTLVKVEQLCSEILVNEQLDKISVMCREIVQREMIHDLRNMYILLKPLNNAIPLLMHEFEFFVRKTGMFISTAAVDPSQFVNNITHLHEKFTKIVFDIFNGDGEFVAALDRAIQSVVNHREDPKQPAYISEKLNKYIDSLMRTRKGRTEAEIETLLTNSIVIFRYIDDKDLFQKYYSKMLSIRLIGNLSFSMDLEESMINKMKEACGYEFTSKLSRMFTDINVSQGLTKRFNEDMLKNNIKLDVPTNVMVLQSGAWPLSSHTGSSEQTSTPNQEQIGNYVPPPILQNSLRLFEEFYVASHSGRKITWLYSHSTAEVLLNYLERQYQVTMSAYQFSIMLLFTNIDSLGLSKLVQQTSLPLTTVLRATKSLLDAGILTTTTNGKELTDSTILNLNTSFTSKRLNLKVMLPQSNRPQEKELEVTCSTLQQDRKYYMECTIVRIMKARKIMKHNALVDEIIKQSQTRFIPDVQFIKKNIEALIDKMYIQRTDENDEYEYIS